MKVNKVHFDFTTT